MWIRSKDKNSLVDADNIYVSGKYVMCTNPSKSGSYTVLGEYSSKEQAMKILDLLSEEINSSLSGENCVIKM